MKLMKTGALCVALAGAAVFGVGAAQADSEVEAGTEQTVTVDLQLLGCALSSGVGVETLLGVAPGTEVTVSEELHAELEAAGCLPGETSAS